MYTSIRRYEGLIPDRVEEVIKRVEEEFVLIVGAGQGFVSFCFVNVGGGVIATIRVFETEFAADESNKAAASWAKENLAEYNPSPPQITAGKVRIYKAA